MRYETVYGRKVRLDQLVTGDFACNIGVNIDAILAIRKIMPLIILQKMQDASDLREVSVSDIHWIGRLSQSCTSRLMCNWSSQQSFQVRQMPCQGYLELVSHTHTVRIRVPSISFEPFPINALLWDPILGLWLPQWCIIIEVSRLVLLSDFEGFHCFAKGLQSRPLCLMTGWLARKSPRLASPQPTLGTTLMSCIS